MSNPSRSWRVKGPWPKGFFSSDALVICTTVARGNKNKLQANAIRSHQAHRNPSSQECIELTAPAAKARHTRVRKHSRTKVGNQGNCSSRKGTQN